MLKFKSWKAVPIALMAISLLSSCGTKKFQKLEQSTSGIAGQYIYIKPKLDMIVFVDNSDSMANALAQVKPQLVNFLNSLDSRWEYRFIAMPLQGTQNLSSKYVVATDCAGISASLCLSPSQSYIFNNAGGDIAWINNRNSGTGNTDLGFYNMKANINHLKAAGFVRNDAILATVVISNGEDVSGQFGSGGVTYATRPDGAITSVDYNSATTQNSYNYFLNYFSTIKNANPVLSKAQTRFYSVVAANRYNDCYGGGMAWQGRRYMDMAGTLGGVTFDLCQGQLPNILTDISGHLQTIVKSLVFNYVVFPEAPTVASIQFKKNGSLVSNSALNGWTYAGNLNNQATSSGSIDINTQVFTPMLSNVRSGYMLRLDGNAELKGTDTYELIYTKL